MSIWNLDLEGFPPQWLDVADRFERGQAQVILKVESLNHAETLRFEWYAFKRKLRAAEKDRDPSERMYPSLPRVRAEIGKLATGEWALRFALRDVGKSALALETALAMSEEEMQELAEQFVSVRRGEET